MPLLLTLLSLLQSGDLLDAVHRERGGRHWIDQKPDPPRAPDQQAATFQIEPGSRIELVAAEPLVMDPVWIDFDHLGRMFVAEYGDYPIGPVNADGSENKSASPLSRIVLLEDTNGDGRMDKRTVFADNLKFCHSFMPLMGGLLVGAQTEILFLKDTDGDNIANVREVWFDGFTPAHPQMQIGCPRWGMDNWIYLTYAPGNVRCRRPGFETDEPRKMPRQDMRFHPLTMKFEPVSGLGQFGNTVDNLGNRFFCTNRNPIMMEMIPQWAAEKYFWVTGGKRHTDVGPSGGDTKVFPLVAMKSNWLSHAGTHTSACGVTAYRGDRWDAEFRQCVFACEPVGHLVTRSIVRKQEDSPALTAQRARPDADFLASTDTWFRPASMRTGPDGALYLADMYRMWVEHPKFLPPEIAAQIDWRAGEDRGRIWRIVPNSLHPPLNVIIEPENLPEPRPPFYRPPENDADLIRLLGDANGWRRDTARRLIIERRSNVATELTRLTQADVSEGVRLSALSALDGMGQLDLTKLPTQVRTDATIARALGRPELFLKFRKHRIFVADSSPHRFFQLLHSGPQLSTDEIATIAFRDSSDFWIQPLLVSASADRSGDVLKSIAYVLSKRTRPSSLVSHVAPELLEQLAERAAGTANAKQISAAFNALDDLQSGFPDLSLRILTGLSQGMSSNRQGPFSSLKSVLENPPESLRAPTTKAASMYAASHAAVKDHRRSGAERVAALKLVALSDPKGTSTLIAQLMSKPQSPELGHAIVSTVAAHPGAENLQAIVTGWKRLNPAVQKAAISMMLTRVPSTQVLLDAMTTQEISPSVVDFDQRLRLLQHRDGKIKTLATNIFGGVVSSDRKAIADEYQPAITMKASAERGSAVFRKTCSKCHKIDGIGANVGPDIADTRNRSRDALLYDILDPNRRVDPQFTAYIVVTTDGRTYNGLLVSDTPQQIILRQAEGKDQTIPRNDIDEFQATPKSLMPVGVEKDVNVQQMADLLEFLKAR